MSLLEVGDTAPAFTLANQDGRRVSLSDFAGRRVLVWFYPRAFGNN
jgi:peroxiredoxin Q/BCP